MNLHNHAAIRVLRREVVRLNEARSDLMMAVGDPRIPAGVISQQLAQCDREIDELVAAHKMLEGILDAPQAEAA